MKAIAFPPKRILVPIDLSDVSFSAWLSADALAEKFQAEMEAVHVREFLPSVIPEKQRTRLSQSKRKELLDYIRSKIGDLPRIHILEGDPVVTILRLARTRNPDLIVMGSHGWTGYDRVLMGSVSETVVHGSPVPVLTARRNPKPIRSILAPVNFTSYSDSALLYAAQAALTLGARLTVLYVIADAKKDWSPKFSLNSLLLKLPKKLREICNPQSLVLEGNPVEQILKASRRHDLIVLAAHKKSLLKDWVLGTTAERVLRYSPIPVLSVPSPRAPSIKAWRQWNPAGSPLIEAQLVL